MKISRKKQGGLTVIDSLVIVAVLTILAGILLPALMKPRRRAQKTTCIHNLKQVGISFRLWAADNGDKYPMHVSTNSGGTREFVEGPETFRHFQVLQNELGTPKITVCPEDKNRKWSSNFFNFSNSNVSYFVGIDADETNATMLLSGDRNITNGFAPKSGMLILTTNQNVRWSKELHEGKNNVGLADGGVQKVSSKMLKSDILSKTGIATNRILLP